MFRVLLLLSCMIFSLYADDYKEVVQNLTQQESSDIDNVFQDKQDTFVSFSHLSLRVGESGIIFRNLTSYDTIVGALEITKIDGTKAIAKLIPFTQLKQPYLPTPALTPQKGDKVIFRSFNDKAFIIAPNEATYRNIITQYPFLNFMNSDLLMGFLNSRGKHDPTKQTLPQACNQYGVGLLFVVGSKNTAIFDCLNVKQILKYPSLPLDTNVTKSPFYTRVNFEGGGSLTYSLSAKKSKDYYKYYDEFIGDLQSQNHKK